MLSIGEALDKLFPAFEPKGTERVSLLDARGRFVVEAIQAQFDSPPFDNSAMDGYAIRAEDVKSVPATLPLAGESRAGGPLPSPLEPGTACRIFTGAPMPAGADTVVMQEDTTAQDAQVTVVERPKPGQHIRGQGTDVRQGVTIVERGSHIGPGEIALLASQNIAAVDVYRRPRVAVLCTGDELRELGAPFEPGMIYNSNAYALGAQIEALGAQYVRCPIAADNLDALTRALKDALENDVVITTGGVSVGEYDFMHEAFARVGVERVFWKVRIKPGKPFAFALGDGVPVIGLPGNPVSAMVTFDILVAPALRKMMGDPKPHRNTITVKLSHDYKRRPGRVEIARATLSREQGQWWAQLKSRQGSGSIPSVVDVDAWLILPSERGELSRGDEIEALLAQPLRSDSTAFAD